MKKVHSTDIYGAQTERKKAWRSTFLISSFQTVTVYETGFAVNGYEIRLKWNPEDYFETRVTRLVEISLPFYVYGLNFHISYFRSVKSLTNIFFS
jgi:hypothetical protein